MKRCRLLDAACVNAFILMDISGYPKQNVVLLHRKHDELKIL